MPAALSWATVTKAQRGIATFVLCVVQSPRVLLIFFQKQLYLSHDFRNVSPETSTLSCEIGSV
jgi:hypothetical protein